MNRNIIETVVGAVVLLFAAFCLYTAYNTGSVSKVHEKFYVLNADFTRADGIDVGSAVKISGIKVGKVSSQYLNKENYTAHIVMNIRDGILLPSDTAAEIVSSGLLGDKYVSLIPGGDTEKMKNGDTIMLTQSSVNLESLIGKMMFGAAGNSKQNPEKSPQHDDAATPALPESNSGNANVEPPLAEMQGEKLDLDEGSVQFVESASNNV